MSTLLDRLRGPRAQPPPEEAAALVPVAPAEIEPAVDPAKLRFSLESLVEQMTYLGSTYPVGLLKQTLTGEVEGPDSSFAGASHIFRSVGPVWSVTIQRMVLFSEALYLWQSKENGIPGRLFGHSTLAPIENPRPGQTTADLAARAELDVSLAGNWFGRRHKGGIWRLRPDWMHIILGTEMDVDDPSEAIDAHVVGYYFRPNPNKPGVALLPNEVAHWAPIPDPEAHYRGMSWVTPILRHASAYSQAIDHKRKFFEQGATPNLVVLPDSTVTLDEMKEFIEFFRDEYEGAWNAYRTLFLGGGSSIESVGISMKDMDYSKIQGIDETMIAAAGNCPPIVAGFSEGLAAATYSNYASARRKFADMYARPQWRSFAGAIEPILDRPPRGIARLWYYDRDIPALREDAKESAQIRQIEAITLQQTITAGYKPDAAVDFVETGDVSVLKGQHTGRLSVQLQPMDEEGEDPVEGDEGDQDDEETPPPPADDEGDE